MLRTAALSVMLLFEKTMYYDKEWDDSNNRTATRMKEEASEDVKLAIKLSKTVKYVKIILAFLLVGAYFYQPQYLTELLIIGLFVSLLLPQGFFDTYLKKLIDLRAAETDERQTLNATEANKLFSSAFERLDKLERKNRKSYA